MANQSKGEKLIQEFEDNLIKSVIQQGETNMLSEYTEIKIELTHYIKKLENMNTKMRKELKK